MAVVIVAIAAVIIGGLVVFMDDMLSNIWGYVFEIESTIPIPNFSNFIYNLKIAFYAVAVSLLIIKFLKKLFDIYALWTEGDPDVHPMQLVINFVKAMVVSLCFPYLWGIFVNVGKELLDKGMEALNDGGTFAEMWQQTYWKSMGLVPTIFGLIFIVMFFILMFKFMKRGIEISLMLVGMPLACIGLLDNDKGIFSPYLNQFSKLLITTLFQILVLKMGVSTALLSDIWSGSLGGIFWAIACLILVFKIPTIMQEFMIPQNQSGGVMMKAYSVGMMANLIRSVAK